jgi:DNA transformation protein
MSSREFLDFVLEQMSQLRGLRSNRMFGGFGIYQGDLFFALIADDRLYLKADAESRADFLARNLAPFTYPRRGVTASLNYYEAPPEVFDDADSMKAWAEKAIGAARRGKQTGRSGRSAAASPRPSAARSKSRCRPA